MSPSTSIDASSPNGGDATALRLRAEIDAAAARVAALEEEYRALLDDPSVIQEDRDAHAAVLAGARDAEAAARSALEVFEAGNYGRCERCGAEIPAERLEAVPDATRCVGCSV